MDRNLDNVFQYHPPREGQKERYEAIRLKAKEFASLIGDTVPSGREQSHAVDCIEQAVMWANAGIARGEA